MKIKVQKISNTKVNNHLHIYNEKIKFQKTLLK